MVASPWPLNGTVIKLWVGFWSHSCWLRTKAQGFIAQGEGEAEGGAGVTQNLLLGWAAGLQLGPGRSADTSRDHQPTWPLLRGSRWIQGSNCDGGDEKETESD